MALHQILAAKATVIPGANDPGLKTDLIGVDLCEFLRDDRVKPLGHDRPSHDLDAFARTDHALPGRASQGRSDAFEPDPITDSQLGRRESVTVHGRVVVGGHADG